MNKTIKKQTASGEINSAAADLMVGGYFHLFDKLEFGVPSVRQ